MSHDPQPLGGKIISKPVMIFGPLIVICMLLIVKRLVFGLGSVSDLNGGFPWGVWIAFDLLIGTGFACGGWALAWAVSIPSAPFFLSNNPLLNHNRPLVMPHKRLHNEPNHLSKFFHLVHVLVLRPLARNQYKECHYVP